MGELPMRRIASPVSDTGNDLSRWVMGGDQSRAAMLPDLIDTQRALDNSNNGGRGLNGGTDSLEQIIGIGTDPNFAGQLPAAIGADLGELGVGGRFEHQPLLGTPNIGADPLAATPRPGFTRPSELPARLSGRADARWPKFGTLEDPVTTAPYAPVDAAGNQVATDAYPFGFSQTPTVNHTLGTEPPPGQLDTQQFYPIQRRPALPQRMGPPSVEDVSTKDLTGTQDYIHPDFLNRRGAPNAGGPVEIMRDSDGRNFVLNGHHRAAEAVARGNPTIRAQVFSPFAEPVTRLPINPTRANGRTAEGGVLPVANGQPFRQSFVGGTGDLNEAAAMRSQPAGLDAGGGEVRRGSALPPLGAAAIAGLSELPRRRTQRQSTRTAPHGAFFMGAQ